VSLASEPAKPNLYLRCLIAVWLVAWGVMAIHPADRREWFLMNILVLIAALSLPYNHRYYPFTNFSYTLIAIYVFFHLLGAHYGYEQVPIGVWLKRTMGTQRNYYDRILHFMFGLLIGYAIHEIYVRYVHPRRFLTYWRPMIIVTAVSAVYEILQVFTIVFIGTTPSVQDETFDSQLDITVAIWGSMISMGIAWLVERRADKRIKGPA
jgi:putative membrane protein